MSDNVDREEDLTFEEILQVLEEELDISTYNDSDDDAYKELDFND